MKLRRIVIATLFLALSNLVPAAPGAPAHPLDSRLTQLSDAGSAEAAYHLGMIHHLGLAGIPKRPEKAFSFFKLAADRGDPLGAYKLGCFYDGQGEGVVETDRKLALKYKLLAAEAGYALAQQDVARHLMDRGDVDGALRWLEAAAAQGDMGALMGLAGLYSDEMPAQVGNLPADPAKSFTYFLIAVRAIPQIRESVQKEAQTKLGADEYRRVMAAVSGWREAPTALTAKADGGVAAAYILAGLPVPSN